MMAFLSLNLDTISSFYQDRSKFLMLASNFARNINKFDESIDISHSICSISEIQEIIKKDHLASKNKKSSSFKFRFQNAKSCLLLLISMNEILTSKNFESFVNSNFFLFCNIILKLCVLRRMQNGEI